MNHQNRNALREIVRQAVRSGADFINRNFSNRNFSGRYQDPDIVDMPQPPALYEQKPGLKIAGILMAIVGFGCGGASLLWSSVLLLGAAIVGEIGFGLGLFGVNLLVVGGCGFLGYKGVSMITSANRLDTYIKTIGQNELCNIKKLAERVRKSEKFVVKDVERMIQRGWFCQGHLDNQKTCLIVTDQMYREYQKIEAEKEQHRIEEEERRRKLREEEEKRRAEEERMKKEMEKEERARRKRPLWNTENNGTSENLYGKRSTGNRSASRAKLPLEVRKVLEQGDAYVKKIRECNDAIPGEEISAKIDRMEVLVDKIFDRVDQNPESVSDIRKLMEYYLPTTVKLLETYAQMDAQPVGGENIQAAKKEIEDSLDTINMAYEKLLDGLFQDMAWDVSTDISVLKTMLAQEGLHEDGFKK